MRETKRVITKAQYLQVEGLLALAQRHKLIVEQCGEALREIVEPCEKSTGGHSGDAVWQPYDARQLLRMTNVSVEGEES